MEGLKNFDADFGFVSIRKTKNPCKKPEFIGENYHRVAIMKKEHLGSEQDDDPTGLPGWLVKGLCPSCGKEFKVRGFYPDCLSYK